MRGARLPSLAAGGRVALAWCGLRLSGLALAVKPCERRFGRLTLRVGLG